MAKLLAAVVMALVASSLILGAVANSPGTDAFAQSSAGASATSGAGR